MLPLILLNKSKRIGLWVQKRAGFLPSKTQLNLRRYRSILTQVWRTPTERKCNKMDQPLLINNKLQQQRTTKKVRKLFWKARRHTQWNLWLGWISIKRRAVVEEVFPSSSPRKKHAQNRQQNLIQMLLITMRDWKSSTLMKRRLQLWSLWRPTEVKCSILVWVPPLWKRNLSPNRAPIMPKENRLKIRGEEKKSEKLKKSWEVVLKVAPLNRVTYFQCSKRTTVSRIQG